MRKKIVYGVGINDADYTVETKIDGIRGICPFYSRWQNMMKRCYNLSYKSKNTTYMDCTVCEEWKYFMTFRAWMIEQDWEGKELDKDLLLPGNKVYGPEYCIFIPHSLNVFTVARESGRGLWPLGVSKKECERKFKASCQNPFIGKAEILGYFESPEEAHEAWKSRKHELALIYASQQTDLRIAKALETRYLTISKQSDTTTGVVIVL